MFKDSVNRYVYETARRATRRNVNWAVLDVMTDSNPGNSVLHRWRGTVGDVFHNDIWDVLIPDLKGGSNHPALQDFLREAEDLHPIALHEPTPYLSLVPYPNPIALIHEEVRPTAMHLLGRFGVTALTIAVSSEGCAALQLEDFLSPPEAA